MIKDKFALAYGRLNPEQKEAVDTIEGPVLVVAGPGTGKTQILTLRIANILKQTDTAPEQILALTFTESGVASMRERLAELIGSRGYAVAINTFHGWCNDVIKKYPEDFPRIIGSKNIHEVEQVEIVEKLIEDLPLKLLRPFGDKFLYLKPMVRALEELKREALSPGEFAEIIKTEKANLLNRPDLFHEKGPHKGKKKGEFIKQERELEKNEELALVYENYEAVLAEKKLYDFSDMIMEVLRALKSNPELLQILQEEHQYVLVDEHQDTNQAQNQIVELLMNYHASPNLFVVGDEKQAIYRFQGASLQNFLYFKEAYPTAKLITLAHNYRSQQTVLDAAHSLLAGAKLTGQTAHAAKPIKIFAFEKSAEEIYWLAHELKAQIAAGTPANELAVLYRDNRDAFPLARMLEKVGVPFMIESDQDLLSHPDVRRLLLIMEALQNFGAPEVLPAVLHLDLFKLEPLVVYQLLRHASEEKISPWVLLKRDEATKEVYEKLARWQKWSEHDDLLTMFEKLVRDSGLLEDILISPGGEDRFEALRRLHSEMATLVESQPEAKLRDFGHYLSTVKKHSLFIKRAKLGGRPGLVRLMTAHRSKGLEFNQVFIMGTYDGHWGGKRMRELLKLVPAVYLPHRQTGSVEPDEDNQDSDERRLFYVALTRAKEAAHISYAKRGDNGREQLPSQFLTEIKPELKEEINTSEWQEKLQQDQALLFSPAGEGEKGSLKDREFIREIFFSQGLSVSALNNYLSCPWKYFYRNLIRLPEAKNKHQLYGTAVHGALADGFRQIKDKDLTKESLLASFESHLSRLPLTKNDYEETLAKGRESLGAWWDNYHQDFARNVLTEFKIAGVLLTEDIRLTGVLDKVEFLDGSNKVRVVDYKTGQPDKKKLEDYHRQLVFYKLLLDLPARTGESRGGFLMQEGLLDFVEPNDSGKFKRETFVITDEQTDELEKVIKQASEEILNLAFWDRRCDDQDCDYCHLRDLLK